MRAAAVVCYGIVRKTSRVFNCGLVSVRVISRYWGLQHGDFCGGKASTLEGGL